MAGGSSTHTSRWRCRTTSAWCSSGAGSTASRAPTSRNRTDAVTLVAPALARFREAFAGEVIGPGDSGYDEARRVWSALHDRRPALVARPTSVEDVVAAVRFARESELVISVRAGGHSISGYSSCDGGI